MMMPSRLRQIAALAVIFYGVEIHAFAALPTAGLERFYIGTYAAAIYVSSLNYASSTNFGTNTFGTVSTAGNNTNDLGSFQPSWVALTPSRNFLYSVDENNGTVLAYSVNPTNGILKFINLKPARAQTPAYIVVDRSGSN